MSLHISAEAGEIAPIVLLAGDPLRAKYIAERFLDNHRVVSLTRNMFYYTGTYKGIRLTIGGSGMGCASIGIYSYELYSMYNVECIIRIGTAGAYTTDLALFDLINANKAYSESTYALCAHNFPEDHFRYQGKASELINKTAAQLSVPIKNCNIHSSDVFYRLDKSIPKIAVENNCLAVEMESFALFSNAQLLGKMAACILTISDIIPTHQFISVDERENALLPMMKLALESAIEIDGALDPK
jgi:purine-nucleoside phosphorylase